MSPTRPSGKGGRVRNKSLPGSASPPSKIEALDAFFSATVSLFHTLTAAAEELHQQGNFTAGKRGVLRGLYRLGPQTVPQMARARPVSRQYIQMLTDQLEGEGLVEFMDNPSHKRSWLVHLTDKGKAMMEAMAAREARLLKEFPVPVSEQELHDATAVLRSMREVFQGHTWKNATKRLGPITHEE